MEFLNVLLLAVLLLGACSKADESPMTEEETPKENPSFFRGGDLSYVNEMLDCGAQYLDETGTKKDPYQIFQEAGTNLIRVRLWHNPDWTAYSTLEDVKKTISRAKALQIPVLLDFHYSDDWADPAKQKVPAAWLPVVNNTSVLGDSLYNYTFQVLKQLNDAGLLPEYVQVGNETNAEILQDPNKTYNSIDWTRNAFLFNRGLQAVRDAAQTFGVDIQSMLHIAQPENALWWFAVAQQNGITNYDWIGISYYPLWSDYAMENLPTAIRTLTTTYGKRLMVVETAYPFTLQNNDSANNILGQDAAVAGFPISEQGQFDYLKALEKKIVDGGGEGLIYWEPAWVSTSCSTQWGQGSHWDNATLFDHNNRANQGMQYYKGE
ncbi:MAG TPA: glycosyl hydrolase 53 family protein [Saprospiraceae bacterium]|nr:glycosyl hydrolase 53 family protein [Saprospiraceae bacterium]HMQ84824.1 glycosyl hydrolase 53 family protein [Saprospiraceae bacterium]